MTVRAECKARERDSNNQNNEVFNVMACEMDWTGGYSIRFAGAREQLLQSVYKCDDGEHISVAALWMRGWESGNNGDAIAGTSVFGIGPGHFPVAVFNRDVRASGARCCHPAGSRRVLICQTLPGSAINHPSMSSRAVERLVPWVQLATGR